MSRFNLSKNQKTILVPVLAVLLLVLVCVVGCFVSNHWTNSSHANNPNSGPFYIADADRTYQYELQMVGTLPNAAAPISLYVYTDDPNLSFAEFRQALLSSQHTDFDFYVSEVPIGKVN